MKLYLIRHLDYMCRWNRNYIQNKNVVECICASCLSAGPRSVVSNAPEISYIHIAAGNLDRSGISGVVAKIKRTAGFTGLGDGYGAAVVDVGILVVCRLLAAPVGGVGPIAG